MVNNFDRVSLQADHLSLPNSSLAGLVAPPKEASLPNTAGRHSYLSPSADPMATGVRAESLRRPVAISAYERYAASSVTLGKAKRSTGSAFAKLRIDYVTLTLSKVVPTNGSDTRTPDTSALGAVTTTRTHY